MSMWSRIFLIATRSFLRNQCSTCWLAEILFLYIDKCFELREKLCATAWGQFYSFMHLICGHVMPIKFISPVVLSARLLFVFLLINMGKLVWCLFILFSSVVSNLPFHYIYKVVNWNTELRACRLLANFVT